MERPRVIALVATPNFKDHKGEKLCEFVYQHLYWLTQHFKVISTGKTYAKVKGFVSRDYDELRRSRELFRLIEESLERPTPTRDEINLWRNNILSNFAEKSEGQRGMIEITNELVQGRVDAVIQLSLGDDTTVRAGSAVLRREANVHDVPIASDLAMADTFVRYWKTKISQGATLSSLFPSRREVVPPFEHLSADGDRVLALIAHDGRKDQMHRFLVEYSRALQFFDHIIATRHSGESAKQYLRVAGWRPTELDKILTGESGGNGGDVQIAMAVIRGICHNVLFFQDPSTSHPHQADIRLVEQAILEETGARLATNAESARILVEDVVAHVPFNTRPDLT